MIDVQKPTWMQDMIEAMFGKPIVLAEQSMIVAWRGETRIATARQFGGEPPFWRVFLAVPYKLPLGLRRLNPWYVDIDGGADFYQDVPPTTAQVAVALQSAYDESIARFHAENIL